MRKCAYNHAKQNQALFYIRVYRIGGSRVFNWYPKELSMKFDNVCCPDSMPFPARPTGIKRTFYLLSFPHKKSISTLDEGLPAQEMGAHLEKREEFAGAQERDQRIFDLVGNHLFLQAGNIQKVARESLRRTKRADNDKEDDHNSFLHRRSLLHS